MSYIPETFGSAFGYHTIRTVPGLSQKFSDNQDALFLNVFNVIGYFPILGLATAGGRIFAIVNAKCNGNNEMSSSTKVAFAVRAFFEATCLGIVLLPIDIMVSLFRFGPWSNQNEYRQLNKEIAGYSCYSLLQ